MRQPFFHAERKLRAPWRVLSREDRLLISECVSYFGLSPWFSSGTQRLVLLQGLAQSAIGMTACNKVETMRERLLLCMYVEGFSHSFPSSTVKSNFVYQRFNRSPPVGHFCIFIFYAGIGLTSQRVRRCYEVTSEPPGRPAI